MWVKHDQDMDLMKMFTKVSHDRESRLRFWMSLCMQTCMFTRELESGLSACMKVFHDRILGPRMFMYVPKLPRIYANMTKCLYKHAYMYLCFRKEMIMCLAYKYVRRYAYEVWMYVYVHVCMVIVVTPGRGCYRVASKLGCCICGIRAGIGSSRE